ncbi:HET-domain-containing protein, partial [Canariomyces notabilis]
MFQKGWIDSVFLAVVPDIPSRSPTERGNFEYISTEALAVWVRDSILSSGFIARVGSNCIHGTRSLDIRELSSNSIDFGMVRDWVELCGTSHSRLCKPRKGAMVPHLRLIECATRRIVSPSSAVPFVALSYVWGPPTPGSVLTSDEDLDTLGDGEVEPVVEDAILVTRRLGYAYLWVDRYCIVKKDKAIRALHLRSMGDIYGSSEITIIAAAGNDSSFGLPGVRAGKPRTPQFRAQVKGHALTSIPPDPASTVRSSVWATRGWTYQEGLLSRRRLIFTEHEVSYECRGVLLREAVQVPARIHKDSYKYSNRLQAGSWCFPTRATDSHFLALVSNYTRRRLTYQSDILNAMLGIFGTFFSSEIHHLCGIPLQPRDDPTDETLGTVAESLVNGLRWDLSSPGHRRPGFPSWS